MKITDIDPNFKDLPIADSKVEYYEIGNAQKFSLTGVFYEPQKQAYARVVRETLDAINEEGMEYLSYCSAGGEVRFITDSPIVIVKADMLYEVNMPHMPRTGSSGFDIYCNSIFAKNVKPMSHEDMTAMGIGYAGAGSEKKSRNFSVLLPLYNGVKAVEIGVLEGSEIQAYNVPRKRVIFYGSSITQGGCASKPGNSYPAMISRWHGIEQINLGFSGNAKGRMPMVEYITSIACDLWVMDYDYNAPDTEYLAATHEPMFKIFRQANPDTPVIFVSNPNARPDRNSCKEVILKTYHNALNRGDTNVYFIDGKTLLEGMDRDACTMDGTHPNDLGFFRMASVIGQKIIEIL